MTATPPARTRRLLVPLATLVAASGIALASGASFTSSTASTGLVASGTLKQTNSNTVAFSGSNLKPGDVVSGAVTISNNGTLPATFSLTESGTSTFAPTAVSLQIANGSTTVYSGPLGAATTPIPLGTFTAGESRTYAYTVTFDQAADNSQQSKTANTLYTFSSVSTAGQPVVSPTGAPTTSPN